MSPEERALYDGATEHLLRPDLYAFQGRWRQSTFSAKHELALAALDMEADSPRVLGRRVPHSSHG